jgi:hypothetical protein
VKRGRVLGEDAVAWSNGRVSASEYFARARERALASALRAVRAGLGGATGRQRNGRP